MELTLSISSILGYLSNVNFHERDYADLPLTDHIVGYCSNFGSKGVLKNTRVRQVSYSAYRQGSGQYFNSQITFFIKWTSDANPLHIKLFRNGKFICIGYTYTTLDVFYKLTDILIKYLTELNKGTNGIQLEYHRYILQNYKTTYSHGLQLAKLHEHLTSENNKYVRINVEYVSSNFTSASDVRELLFYPTHKFEYIHESDIDKVIARLQLVKSKLGPANYTCKKIEQQLYTDICVRILSSFIVRDHNVLYSSYNPTKFSGLILKCKTINDSSDNKITIKLFKSGKINIDGKQDLENASFYCKWLDKILINFKI